MEKFTKVIFLDIDGVLNCRSTKSRFGENGAGDRVIIHNPPEDKKGGIIALDSNKVKLLNSLVNPGTAFVLSSTWGIHMSLDEVQGFLEECGFEGFLIDVTPKKFSSGRGHEINWWLEDHPSIKQYVILDDAYIFNDNLRVNQIQTNWEDGLNEEHVQSALDILNGET